MTNSTPDDAAELFDELHLRPGGPPAEHVVDDDDAHAFGDGVPVHVQAVPYSRSYVASTVSRGSLPGLRAAMNPAPSSW